MDDVKSAAACHAARKLHTIEWSFSLIINRLDCSERRALNRRLPNFITTGLVGMSLIFSFVILASIPSNPRDPFMTNNNNSIDLISYEVLTGLL